ncbi:RHOMBOID-like protein 12, mitochondrial isoform X2 [Physcomitrium patens]|uniref:Peptidase S54 rhomboid domain-containing protein n=2 Tax=Physcomitrium patens TaxID=3218 RepID=A0A2K1IMN7_PHYPA|nr:RHOMBOID-like protein 12, mitochondrial isoform X2 [Physcomitrium patens]PNR30541.1 hypothetical protein PHYPA_026857 [Physcomitrium patens]|eukprot:XP_024361052.1 RHOMBOID-like protein 12, mitochondrial isoform X2 [Physcomitrella patens]
MLAFALLRQASRQTLGSPVRNLTSLRGYPGSYSLVQAGREGLTSPLRSFLAPRKSSLWSPMLLQAAKAGQQGIAVPVRNFSLSRWSNIVRAKLGSSRGYGSGYGGYAGGNAQRVVWGLVGVNLAVFGLWQFADRKFMTNNFMVSVNSVLSGRIHTIVTSAFSQASFNHLIMNMLGLYFFGTEVAQIFGGRWLLNLYLVGGIAGSIGHLVYCAFVIPWLENIPQHRFNARYTPSALGASGAVNAIVLLHILLFPSRTIMVNFFIPVPAALFGVYLIGSDVWQARNEGSRTAHAGHLGGALVGALAWLRVRRRW